MASAGAGPEAGEIMGRDRIFLKDGA